MNRGLNLAHPADAWHTRASREVGIDDGFVNYLIYVFSKQNPTLTDFRCFEHVEINEEVIDLRYDIMKVMNTTSVEQCFDISPTK